MSGKDGSTLSLNEELASIQPSQGYNWQVMIVLMMADDVDDAFVVS